MTNQEWPEKVGKVQRFLNDAFTGPAVGSLKLAELLANVYYIPGGPVDTLTQPSIKKVGEQTFTPNKQVGGIDFQGTEITSEKFPTNTESTIRIRVSGNEYVRMDLASDGSIKATGFKVETAPINKFFTSKKPSDYIEGKFTIGPSEQKMIQDAQYQVGLQVERFDPSTATKIKNLDLSQAKTLEDAKSMVENVLPKTYSSTQMDVATNYFDNLLQIRDEALKGSVITTPSKNLIVENKSVTTGSLHLSDVSPDDIKKLSSFTKDNPQLSVMLDGAKMNADAFRIIKSGDQTIGMINIDIMPEVKGAYVANLNILPQFQREGLGTETIYNIFQSNSDIGSIVGRATSESQGFWESVGAKVQPESLKFNLSKESFDVAVVHSGLSAPQSMTLENVSQMVSSGYKPSSIATVVGAIQEPAKTIVENVVKGIKAGPVNPSTGTAVEKNLDQKLATENLNLQTGQDVLDAYARKVTPFYQANDTAGIAQANASLATLTGIEPATSKVTLAPQTTPEAIPSPNPVSPVETQTIQTQSDAGTPMEALQLTAPALKSQLANVVPFAQQNGLTASETTALTSLVGNGKLIVPKSNVVTGENVKSGKIANQSAINIETVKSAYLNFYNKSQGAGTAIKPITTGQVIPSALENLPTPPEIPAKMSTTLSAEVIPGLSKTIEEDIKPMTKGSIKTVGDIMKEVVAMVNPTSLSDSKGLDIVMKHKGEMERVLFRTERAMKAVEKMWDKQPESARFDFMDKVETGQPVPKEFQALVDMYRNRLDNLYNAISKYKNINFVANFFPHFWKKPDEITSRVLTLLTGRKPLAGAQTFLKQRIFDTIQVGIKAGYEPISTNPETLMQVYEQNVQRFIMAQNIKADMTDKGLFTFVKNGAEAPKDFARINDSIARIYFPQEIVTSSGEGATTLIKAGEYWAQKDLARIINNHLSIDWISSSQLGRSLMNAKNTLNAFQLGFSAFHLTMESLDSVITKFSIGISQILNGKVGKGLLNMITSPAAPITYLRAGQKFYNGNPELMKIENDLFTGGASLRKKQYYKNTVLDTFLQRVREGNYLGALGRLPLATIEGVVRPMFGYYIPRLKVGTWRDLFASELTKNEKAIAEGKITRETIARSTFNNIENRLGEVNYDNLFWNRTFKSTMMLTFRAVGWNLGTARELGGAFFQDIPKAGWDALRGKKPVFTPKMSYALALFTVIGSLGAVYQYLHIGKKPKSAKDLFYPQNGEKDINGNDYRVAFPSYLKDLYSFSHKPITTVGNKLSPEFSMAVQLLNNRDFFGDFIANKADPWQVQLQQYGAYTVSQFQPFSFQQIAQQAKGVSGPEQKAEAFFGVIKAPKEIIQSQWEKDLQKAYTEQVGAAGPKTPEQKDVASLKAQARADLKNGKLDGYYLLIEKGILDTETKKKNFIKTAGLTGNERMLKGLSKDEKTQLLKDLNE